MYTRRRFLVASAVAALPLGAWWTLGRPSQAGTSTGAGVPSSSTSSIAPTRANGIVDQDVAPPPTAPEVDVPALTHELKLGVVDPKVGMVQQRLTDLAFDPGPVDDYFGEATLRSVWAFQKLVSEIDREDADGVVSPALWDALHDRVSIAPRRAPGGTHLEVYLPEQVAVIFENGSPRVVSHVSSGEGVEWCDEVTIDLDDGTQETKGICGLSITPGGVYHFERKIEGWRNAKLGRLYKPVYFNYGIAIHGATKVPNYPASRGCVRFPMHIAEYLQEIVDIGDAVYVFDGVEEPEHYGAQPMRFDWPDPDFTTTTTSTTTTTTTTTTAPPSTTSPATPTTTVPPTTTTPTTTTTVATGATTTTTLPPG